ncbi:MAG: lipopolysaccharide assembly protein LapA domain-containing protein [Candidatus Nanopelagicales bacterium]
MGQGSSSSGIQPAGRDNTGQAGANAPSAEVYGRNPSARKMTAYIKPTLWGILIVYVVLFLLMNRDSTQINFVFFEATAPLVVALLVVFVIGLLVGGGLIMFRSRRDQKAGARKAQSKAK